MEVDSEVVVAASSEVMGRVLVRVEVVLRVMKLAVMGKLAAMVTRPWPVLIAPLSVAVDRNEPPPPPEAQ
jgi:hypothetical protein